jgi:short-subunit dehydrogenase
LQKINKANQDWLGKTALVTGASSGIGAATALLLASKGIQVILVARRLERLKQIANEIKSKGGKALVLTSDLSTAEGCEELCHRLNQQNIHIDVLVNNAGFAWYGYFADMPWDIVCDMLQVDVSAVAHLTRLILPGMMKRHTGHVVNIGSIAGGFPNQGVAIYSASKAFLDAFTTSIYCELRGSGVHISVLRPGPVKTEFFQSARRIPSSGIIPGEGFAISPQRVAQAVWSLLEHPRRVAYVPWFMRLSKLIELVFGGLIDKLGPLLLHR